ncbi:hypothetical protein BD289DRAFT_478632 [Coniella lustricola]|uniref:Uncharacterized protein n=1 Tax=Coniella lustricola TaxID=2025994 RepID=A0A2T3AM76_9PEZI|nr:hypothetical protein BD289DRAFT_478632 [Coniella lustricola]
MESDHNLSRQVSPPENNSLFVEQDHPNYEPAEYQYQQESQNYALSDKDAKENADKNVEGSNCEPEDTADTLEHEDNDEAEQNEDDESEQSENDEPEQNRDEPQSLDPHHFQITPHNEVQYNVRKQEGGDNREKKTECVTCSPETSRLKRLLDTIKRIAMRKNDIIKEKGAEITSLKAEIRNLKEQLAGFEAADLRRLSRKNPRRQDAAARSKSWHQMLRSHLSSSRGDIMLWKKVWKTCYHEENMPFNLRLHPCIELVPLESSDAATTSAVHGYGQVMRETEYPPPDASAGFIEWLPPKIFIKILAELLFFDECLVHVFSRLDPFHEPDSWEAGDEQKSSGLPGRFFISGADRARISLTHDTILARDLLAPLAVSRKWCFYGCSIFYAKNTFAFSSFGELERFANGSGVARVQRITKVELHWMGGKTQENVTSQLNYRVRPLQWLTEMHRLRTLVVFIDESSRSVIRRPDEALDILKYERRLTNGQPNARNTRALRLCQGWDFLHMLRGLKHIRLYDSQKYLRHFDRARSAVRDQSAEIDLNRTARMEVVPKRASLYRIQNLVDLFPRQVNLWFPEKTDYEIAGIIESGGVVYSPEPNDLDKDVKVEEIRRIFVEVAGDEGIQQAQDHNANVDADSVDENGISVSEDAASRDEDAILINENAEYDDDNDASDGKNVDTDAQSVSFDPHTLSLPRSLPSIRHSEHRNTLAAASESGQHGYDELYTANKEIVPHTPEVEEQNKNGRTSLFSVASDQDRFTGQSNSPTIVDLAAIELAKDNVGNQNMNRQKHLLEWLDEAKSSSRIRSLSPKANSARDIKRKRESSVCDSEPSRPRKRQLKKFAYGPQNNWAWGRRV